MPHAQGTPPSPVAWPPSSHDSLDRSTPRRHEAPPHQGRRQTALPPQAIPADQGKLRESIGASEVHGVGDNTGRAAPRAEERHEPCRFASCPRIRGEPRVGRGTPDRSGQVTIGRHIRSRGTQLYGVEPGQTVSAAAVGGGGDGATVRPALPALGMRGDPVRVGHQTNLGAAGRGHGLARNAQNAPPVAEACRERRRATVRTPRPCPGPYCPRFLLRVGGSTGPRGSKVAWNRGSSGVLRQRIYAYAVILALYLVGIGAGSEAQQP